MRQRKANFKSSFGSNNLAALNIRELVSGGSLHLMDFAQPESGARGWRAHLMQANSHIAGGNTPNRVLALMTEAGIMSPVKVAEQTMLFGLACVAFLSRLCLI